MFLIYKSLKYQKDKSCVLHGCLSFGKAKNCPSFLKKFKFLKIPSFVSNSFSQSVFMSDKNLLFFPLKKKLNRRFQYLANRTQRIICNAFGKNCRRDYPQNITFSRILGPLSSPSFISHAVEGKEKNFNNIPYTFRDPGKFKEVKLITLRLASPDTVRRWAETRLPDGKILGIVYNANTLHHNTLKPLKGGLFCERIFGPVKDFQCACGIQKDKNLSINTSTRQFCLKCNVEYTWSLKRRYQLGYIRLVSPVTHLWYVKESPSFIAVMLDMKRKTLDYITYCTYTLTIDSIWKSGTNNFTFFQPVQNTNSFNLFSFVTKKSNSMITQKKSLQFINKSDSNKKSLTFFSTRGFKIQIERFVQARGIYGLKQRGKESSFIGAFFDHSLVLNFNKAKIAHFFQKEKNLKDRVTRHGRPVNDFFQSHTTNRTGAEKPTLRNLKNVKKLLQFPKETSSNFFPSQMEKLEHFEKTKKLEQIERFVKRKNPFMFKTLTKKEKCLERLFNFCYNLKNEKKVKNVSFFNSALYSQKKTNFLEKVNYKKEKIEQTWKKFWDFAYTLAKIQIINNENKLKNQEQINLQSRRRGSKDLSKVWGGTAPSSIILFLVYKLKTNKLFCSSAKFRFIGRTKKIHKHQFFNAESGFYFQSKNFSFKQSLTIVSFPFFLYVIIYFFKNYLYTFSKSSQNFLKTNQLGKACAKAHDFLPFFSTLRAKNLVFVLIRKLKAVIKSWRLFKQLLFSQSIINKNCYSLQKKYDSIFMFKTILKNQKNLANIKYWNEKSFPEYTIVSPHLNFQKIENFDLLSDNKKKIASFYIYPITFMSLKNAKLKSILKTKFLTFYEKASFWSKEQLLFNTYQVSGFNKNKINSLSVYFTLCSFFQNNNNVNIDKIYKLCGKSSVLNLNSFSLNSNFKALTPTGVQTSLLGAELLKYFNFLLVEKIFLIFQFFSREAAGQNCLFRYEKGMRRSARFLIPLSAKQKLEKKKEELKFFKFKKFSYQRDLCFNNFIQIFQKLREEKHKFIRFLAFFKKKFKISKQSEIRELGLKTDSFSYKAIISFFEKIPKNALKLKAWKNKCDFFLFEEVDFFSNGVSLNHNNTMKSIVSDGYTVNGHSLSLNNHESLPFAANSSIGFSNSLYFLQYTSVEKFQFLLYKLNNSILKVLVQSKLCSFKSLDFIPKIFHALRDFYSIFSFKKKKSLSLWQTLLNPWLGQVKSKAPFYRGAPGSRAKNFALNLPAAGAEIGLKMVRLAKIRIDGLEPGQLGSRGLRGYRQRLFLFYFREALKKKLPNKQKKTSFLRVSTRESLSFLPFAKLSFQTFYLKKYFFINKSLEQLLLLKLEPVNLILSREEKVSFYPTLFVSNQSLYLNKLLFLQFQKKSYRNLWNYFSFRLKNNFINCFILNLNRGTPLSRPRGSVTGGVNSVVSHTTGVRVFSNSVKFHVLSRNVLLKKHFFYKSIKISLVQSYYISVFQKLIRKKSNTYLLPRTIIKKHNASRENSSLSLYNNIYVLSNRYFWSLEDELKTFLNYINQPSRPDEIVSPKYEHRVIKFNIFRDPPPILGGGLIQKLLIEFNPNESIKILMQLEKQLKKVNILLRSCKDFLEARKLRLKRNYVCRRLKYIRSGSYKFTEDFLRLSLKKKLSCEASKTQSLAARRDSDEPRKVSIALPSSFKSTLDQSRQDSVYQRRSKDEVILNTKSQATKLDLSDNFKGEKSVRFGTRLERKAPFFVSLTGVVDRAEDGPADEKKRFDFRISSLNKRMSSGPIPPIGFSSLSSPISTSSQLLNKKDKKLPFNYFNNSLKITNLRSFLKESRPEWMVLSVLPVLPPDLRPILQIGNQVASSDLNRLYQKVLYRNERLKRFLKDSTSTNSPQMKFAYRLLQEAVDNLIDNGKGKGNAETDNRGLPLKSLTELLKGKKGRFRQNLLGKRVDYSGRSVIVVGPRLRLHECGLPKEMAIELFMPFLIQKIFQSGQASTILGAKKILQNDPNRTWEFLNMVLRENPVLLNRAPTLHRFGFQAFQPRLVEGKAILLHPLVCPAFNADFDGDQMAVHVPITVEAKVEAWKIMLARNHLLSAATGEVILVPSQDMVLGSYYLTAKNPKFYKKQLFLQQYNYVFSTIEEVLRAYESQKISLHSIIWLRWNDKFQTNGNNEKLLELQINRKGQISQIFINYSHSRDKMGNIINSIIQTTPGRVLFHNFILQNRL
uniref:DNA-directed RNA polymerase subunit n=1 Tax=Draparnaldia mutabilis TaxID=1683230 RepID=A0A6H1U8K7_9CHLO|nr:RNA polymerase beta' subunit [Draparnaldia mutabilis]